MLSSLDKLDTIRLPEETENALLSSCLQEFKSKMLIDRINNSLIYRVTVPGVP